jgi:hypothetical protein
LSGGGTPKSHLPLMPSFVHNARFTFEASEFAFRKEIDIVLLESLIDPAFGVVFGNPANLDPE